MTKLLYIQASPRRGASRSIAVADAYLAALKAKTPDLAVRYDRVVGRGSARVRRQQERSQAHVFGGGTTEGVQATAWDEIVAIATRFTSADRYLFAIPMWNGGIPYKLKQYIDIIHQPGLTFGAQPQNSGYFRDPVHLARVQAWRTAHPGYGSGKPRRRPALQDPLITQVQDTIEECPIRDEIAVAPSRIPLQDLLNTPSPVLAGLIAHLFEVTLQEDMAATTRRLVQLGHDVINRGRDEDSQASAAARAAAPGARAVQLD